MTPQYETSATLIVLVRHGETPTTGKLLPGRAPGLDLNARGRQQAIDVAQRVGVLPVHAIYASPLERTMQTAAPTAALTGVPVVEEPGLLEGDFGDWTGAALAKLVTLPEWVTVQQDPARFRFPNGESFTEIRDRMVTTLATLRDRHPGKVVVCFSHADPIRIAVSDALGNSLEKFQRISIAPCSVSAITYPVAATQTPVVLTINSTLESLASLRAS